MVYDAYGLISGVMSTDKKLCYHSYMYHWPVWHNGDFIYSLKKGSLGEIPLLHRQL